MLKLWGKTKQKIEKLENDLELCKNRIDDLVLVNESLNKRLAEMEKLKGALENYAAAHKPVSSEYDKRSKWLNGLPGDESKRVGE